MILRSSFIALLVFLSWGLVEEDKALGSNKPTPQKTKDCAKILNPDTPNARGSSAIIKSLTPLDPFLTMWQMPHVKKLGAIRNNMAAPAEVRAQYALYDQKPASEAMDQMKADLHAFFRYTQKDLEINSTNKEGKRLLELAIDMGFSTLVKALLDMGADPNLKDLWGNTSLHRYFSMNPLPPLDILNSLLDKNPQLANVLNNKHQSPLLLGVKAQSVEALDILLQYAYTNPDPDQYFHTPLTKAFELQNMQVAQKLIEHGARSGNRKIKGRKSDSVPHRSLLHTLIQHSPNIDDLSPHALEMALDAGAAPNIQNHQGDTPLHTLAQRGDIVSFKGLVELGANPNIFNQEGSTPFFDLLPHISEDSQLLNLIAELNPRLEPNVPKKFLKPLALERIFATSRYKNSTQSTFPLALAMAQARYQLAKVLVQEGLVNINAPMGLYLHPVLQQKYQSEPGLTQVGIHEAIGSALHQMVQFLALSKLVNMQQLALQIKETMAWFIKKGLDPNAQLFYTEHYSTANGHGTIKPTYISALGLCIQLNDFDCFKYMLLEHKVDPNLGSPYKPLHNLIVGYHKLDRAEHFLSTLLMDPRTDISATVDLDGNSFLHLAAAYIKDPKVLDTFAALGGLDHSLLTAKNAYDLTPLQLSEAAGNNAVSAWIKKHISSTQDLVKDLETPGSLGGYIN